MKYTPSSPETKLIRNLLFAGQNYIPDSPYNWHKFVHCGYEEDVAAVLFYLLKKRVLTGRVPLVYSQALARRFHQNLISNLSLRGHLKLVLAMLNECGAPHLLLKGFALAEYIYPSIAMRGMSDVDLLIRKSDLTIIDSCLRGFGYGAVDVDSHPDLITPEGYLSSLEYRQPNVGSPILHIHWHPVNTSVPAFVFSKFMNVDRLWQFARMVQLDNVESRILAPEHLLICLCEHALRINHSFNRLILVYDLQQVLTTCKDQLDWEFVVQESEDFHLTDLVYFGLAAMEHLSPGSVPSRIMDRLRPDRLTWEQRFFQYLQSHGFRIRGSSYLLYLAMNTGVKGKGHFMYRTLFPPAAIQGQRKRARISDTSFPVHYSRFGEIFRQLIYTVTQGIRRRY
ncbi:MAG: nucleotidyltransferase family protein [Syntrophales bacterium]